MTQRWKVLHVYKYFRPDFTGEGVFLERIAPVFARLAPSVEHDVLCTQTAKPTGPFESPTGVGRVDYMESGGKETLWESVRLVWWTLFNVGRYRTVHYHTHVDRTCISYWLASLLGRRIVLSATLDDSPPKIAMTYRPWFRPLVRFLLKRFDAFVSISPKLQCEALELVEAGRAHLIPMGINMPEISDGDRRRARANLGIADDEIALVCVAGICERKDQMTLVRAMPAVLRGFPHAVLILVGPVLESDYAKALEKFVADNGFGQSVRFAGWVREPWPYYAAADVMVFASTEEGFGTVLIEAMSFALPVVARLLKGVNDSFIKHGETGLLYERSEQFENLVLSLLADLPRRYAIGNAAREFVLPRYGMEHAAKRYMDIYGSG